MQTLPMRNRPAMLVLFLSLSLVLAACKDPGPKMELPSVKQGNNLTLVAKEVIEKDKVYYRDTDNANYSLSASKGNKLVLVRMQVYNRSARSIKLQVGQDGYILLDPDGKDYKSLNPFGETRRLEPTLPSKESPIQFIWGPFEMQQGFSIEAYAVFDVAKNIKPWQFRWNPVETVFVPFFPLTTKPPQATQTPVGAETPTSAPATLAPTATAAATPAATARP